MFSQRRIAQSGILAASLVLVTCMTVLVAGARDDRPTADIGVTPVLSDTRITSISIQPITAPASVNGPVASR